ncbi:MAG: bacterial transcriptional activator domain-containing protein, partial [Candidatus Paceibacterota bacterium]
DIYSDSELIRAYSAVGEYDKAITLLENRVELQQNNIQAWASLAAAYYEAGRISEAIETLEQAKERFPQAATQIDGFIADIRAGELSI